MDSTQTDLLAAGKVRDKITLTDRLRPYITDNDKTPVWDGKVLLYKKSKHKSSNKYLLGSVEVQIKGKENSNLFKSSISYSIEVNDLNIYINNGGVIFFVVYIDKNNPDLRKIYYETLPPVKIKRYLKGKETQQTVTIKLGELPDSNKHIESIFFNFYNNKNKQYSFKDRPLISWEDISKRKDIKSVKCEYVKYSSDSEALSPVDLFFQNDAYFYAEIEGSPIPHPIDISHDNLTLVRNSIVSIKGEEYKDYLKIIQKRNNTTFEFGKSLSITFTKGSDQWDVTYMTTSMLSHRIRDMEFFIKAIESEGIVLGKNEMVIPLSWLASDNKIKINTKKKELKKYYKIRRFLKTLHVTDDLDLNEVEKNSNWQELMTLVNGVIDKKPISFTMDNNDQHFLYHKRLGNLKILFSLEKVDNSNNRYFIKNYFDAELILKIIRDDKEEYITSLYSAMTPENYNELSNLNLPKMLDSYKPFLAWNSKIFNSANFDVLNLLFAYDSAENPKQIILNTAKDIAKWILDESGNKIPHTVKWLNYLQILKRERELNVDERNQLLDIIEDSNTDMISIVAANLLLDNQLAAERHFNKLDNNSQEVFKSFPIYRFWET